MKNLDQFKAAHDSSTIIGRLEERVRELESQVGLEGAIREILGTAKLRLDKVDPPAWVNGKLQAGCPGVPTLFLSDLHWGEKVEPAEINGVNEFGLATAHRRLRHTVGTAVHLLEILDPKMAYPGIVLPLGGDMISGDIHEELQATNELATIPTVLDLEEQLTSTIRTLAEAFGKVFLPCVSGNHGRNTRKPWAKQRNATSFDWLLYQMLARRFAGDKRVQLFIPAGSDALYRVFNTRYLLTHGDQFRAGDSIIGPIGPLTRGNQKKLARNQAVGQDYDVMIAGHWHTYIHTARMIINGSLKGYDEYAAANNFGFEPPQQALWVTHPRFGINWRMPILCELPKAPGAKASWVSVAA